MITYEEFAKAICEGVSLELGEEVKVCVQDVNKNNGVILKGLNILESGCNIAPTIYLEDYYEYFNQGRSIEDIVKKVISSYEHGKIGQKIDMSFFTDFSQVKDGICYRLVNSEKNKALLEKIPHVEYMDLSICFYYLFRSEMLGEGAITILNEHMKMWECSVQELLELAEKNTPLLLPVECESMQEVLKDFLTDDLPDDDFTCEKLMYVLSNVKGVNGAAVILYPDVLKKFAERVGKSFYVIPSSINETILLPDNEDVDEELLCDMIDFVNSTQVSDEEVLSNCLYYYDAKKGILERCSL